MRFPLKTELAPAELAPDQQDCCGSNYHQRHQLLPIHVGNITSNRCRATTHSICASMFLGLRRAKSANPATGLTTAAWAPSAWLQRFAIAPREPTRPTYLIVGCVQVCGHPRPSANQRWVHFGDRDRSWIRPQGRNGPSHRPQPSETPRPRGGWRGNGVAPVIPRCGSHGDRSPWEPHRSPSG